MTLAIKGVPNAGYHRSESELAHNGPGGYIILCCQGISQRVQEVDKIRNGPNVDMVAT